jgi:hypothetical protein
VVEDKFSPCSKYSVVVVAWVSIMLLVPVVSCFPVLVDPEGVGPKLEEKDKIPVKLLFSTPGTIEDATPVLNAEDTSSEELDKSAEVWRASLPSSATVTEEDAAKLLLLDAKIAVTCGLGDDIVALLVVSGVSNATELLVGMKAKFATELAVSPAITRLEVTADAVPVLPPCNVIVIAAAVGVDPALDIGAVVSAESDVNNANVSDEVPGKGTLDRSSIEVWNSGAGRVEVSSVAVAVSVPPEGPGELDLFSSCTASDKELSG